MRKASGWNMHFAARRAAPVEMNALLAGSNAWEAGERRLSTPEDPEGAQLFLKLQGVP